MISVRFNPENFAVGTAVRADAPKIRLLERSCFSCDMCALQDDRSAQYGLCLSVKFFNAWQKVAAQPVCMYSSR
ncbi:Protein of unknown function [Pyronema omphalodes CBS 100304]|uniref:Uncharacterized protein n=1 Tax=Pyronema omphalodes (strain CBS 100304) TaxID=1076935 RepID=U4LLD4_PYROM|nr:Protein of unknown function [Pyronema omphalodes CBS 100304]